MYGCGAKKISQPSQAMLDRLAKVINISKDYLDDTHRIISNKPKKELVLHKECLDRYTEIKSKKSESPTSETDGNNK